MVKMLIAKIFINEKQIDEIHIQNVGLTRKDLPESNIYEYKIRKPKLSENITLTHRRTDNYAILLQKALHYVQFT